MGLFDQLKSAGASMLKEAGASMLKEAGVSKLGQPKQQPQAQVQTQPTVQQSTSTGIYNPQLEKLIDIALADGELTEKEKQVLFKRAEAMGIDLDEFEMVLDAKLYEQNKSNNASANNAAPKSNKFGDIKKCPACGAVLQSFTTKCPDCGFEFRNVEANCTIQRLFELLNTVEEDSSANSGLLGDVLGLSFEESLRKKMTIIQNFPIPNTREDILEFLALAVPLAKKRGLFTSGDATTYRMQPTWKAKCEQIIIKAKLSMKEDPATLAEVLEYGKQLGIK